MTCENWAEKYNFFDMKAQKNFHFEFNRPETAQLRFSEQKLQEEIRKNFSKKSFDLSLKYLEAVL